MTDTKNSSAQAQPSRAKAWLQLIRLPNLFTIPGDILAGALIMGAWDTRIILLIACSAMIYSAGLILNDILDYEQDCKERVNRPLPSGVITKQSAWIATIILGIGGLLLAGLVGKATLIVAFLLCLFVVLYDGAARKIAWIGFLTMGCCRGANLLLGGSFYVQSSTIAEGSDQFSSGLWIAVIIETVYIVIVTAIAYHEAQFESLQKRIGQLIRLLIVMQASFILIFNIQHWIIALGLLLLWSASGYLGKRFYSS